MVVGAGVVTVNTIVVGVSACVMTIVDTCVWSTVCVLVMASVTVAVGALPPSVESPPTATTEYVAGFLRSTNGRALAVMRSVEMDRALHVLDFMLTMCMERSWVSLRR
jgi:hypothetical protein